MANGPPSAKLALTSGYATDCGGAAISDSPRSGTSPSRCPALQTAHERSFHAYSHNNSERKSHSPQTSCLPPLKMLHDPKCTQGSMYWTVRGAWWQCKQGLTQTRSTLAHQARCTDVAGSGRWLQQSRTECQAKFLTQSCMSVISLLRVKE